MREVGRLVSDFCEKVGKLASIRLVRLLRDIGSTSMSFNIEKLDWGSVRLNAIDPDVISPDARQGTQLAEILESRHVPERHSTRFPRNRLRDARDLLELLSGGTR